ncbi:plectin-like isoform X1 [Lates japonicus]|uniref:Plectin-like isoform X1 n=1 Tax=Lates japonicus TaxID=270547 RepID=A0AAD3M871_LATJO|nr:plectin-like isoform X1 [Lates japonicus]
MVAGMLMPLRDLRAIYEVLFRDGVMVAKKDKRPQIKHPEVQGVSNLQVIRAMGSLKSRGYVKETFAWRHFYWYLTNEGIVYLRDYLRLPPEIVPASLQRVRKPAATLAIAHRAARVQSVEGPTSYVPKPGRRGETESQEALADRQGYRHKMMGPGERESFSDRTPRFRGRPMAAEPVRPKASWEVEDKSQPLFRNGDGFRSEAVMMEETRVKRVSREQPDVSSERPVTTSQERRVYEVQKEKTPSSVPVQTAASKQDVSQTTLTSVSSKTALPLTVAAVGEATGGATSKIPAEPFAPKTNKEKSKIVDEKAVSQSNEMVTCTSSTIILPDTKVKEEKTTKVIVDPVKSAEVKSIAEMAAGIVKPKALAATQETIGLLSDTVTAAPVIIKPVDKGVKEEKTIKVIVDQVKSAEVKTTVASTPDKVKPPAVTTMASAQETYKPLTDTAITTPKSANKDVKEEKVQKAIVKEESIKPAGVKTPVESKIEHQKSQKTARVTITQETTKPAPTNTTSEPVLSTDEVTEISKVKVTQKPIDTSLTSVSLSAKPKTDEVLPKTTTSTIMLPDTKVKEEKTKRVIVDPVKSAEVKSTAEMTADIVKPEAVIKVAATQETISLLTDIVTAAPVIRKPVDKGVKEEKTTKVIVDHVKFAEVKTTVATTPDKVKPQTVTTMASAQETYKPLTDTATTTPKSANKDIKEEKVQKAIVKEESIEPAGVKTPVESKIEHQKAKKTARVTITQETTKPAPTRTTSEPVLSTDEVTEISKVKVTQEPIDTSLTSVSLSAKPKTDEVLKKTTSLTESSIPDVATTVATTATTLSAPVANAEDAQPVKGKTTVTEIITEKEKTEVKCIPHVMKDEKIVLEEVAKVSVQDPTLAQKDSSSPQPTQNVDTTEVVKETKQVVEGSSKSKRKKKKSPGEISKSVNPEEVSDTKVEKEKTSKDKPQEEVAESTPQPTPVVTTELLTVSTSVKTEEASHVEKNEAKVKININRRQIKDISKQTDGKPKNKVHEQTETISEEASLSCGQITAVPPVELPDIAQVKENVAESSVSKTTQGPLCPQSELNAKLPLVEPVKSEDVPVNKVETVTVQKITQVELIQQSYKPEEKSSAPLSESQKPTVETKSLISTGKAAEESSKIKKKGRGKKQAKALETETINTKPVLLHEGEALPSTDITSLPKATVKDSPVTASELTEMNVSPKMTPERMCREENEQAAAVLSEAPADKGEVEPALLFAEKIKREVPKPKTSSTAREAPAAGELASAAPAVTAAVAQAQASPLVKQEEPPRVAQHSATQAAERSTEKRLSVSEALKQEEEKKRDLKEDTPSSTATPAVAQPDHPHLGDTCESVNPDIDEAAMRRKIVVVEEIVEVKQLISPEATGEQSQPPPVPPEVEGDELDLDVLEEIAIERALLSGATEASVLGASPEADWDHSLEEPEEKTWPNFIEGSHLSLKCGRS